MKAVAIHTRLLSKKNASASNRNNEAESEKSSNTDETINLSMSVSDADDSRTETVENYNSDRVDDPTEESHEVSSFDDGDASKDSSNKIEIVDGQTENDNLQEDIAIDDIVTLKNNHPESHVRNNDPRNSQISENDDPMKNETCSADVTKTDDPKEMEFIESTTECILILDRPTTSDPVEEISIPSTSRSIRPSNDRPKTIDAYESVLTHLRSSR